MSEKEEKSAASRSSKADPAERLSDTGSGAGPSDGESNSSATVLIPHDVLLGRGSGCNDYEGNVMFRSLVEERKREYLSAVTTREDKNRIAQEIFDQITMNGGRFLKKEDKGKMNGAIVNKGVYVQVHPGVALEKVKQALRQRWQNRRQQVTQVYNTGATNEILSHDDDRSRDQSLPQPPFDTLPEVASASICSAIQGFVCPQVNHFSYLSDPFQSTLFRSTVNPASACAQLLLFQRAQKALHQQPTLLRSLSLQQSLEQLAATSSTDQLSTVSQNWDQSDNLSRPSTNTSSLHASGGHPLLNGTIRSFPRQTGLVVPEKITQDSLLHAESSQGKKPTKESLESSVSEDALVALDALSTLSMTGRPKFTDQQRSEELALLSDEERLQALMDKFGRLYIGDRQTKKPRRDINQLSISFLVSQMKLELDRIPGVEKLAMLEANAKCRLYEFSDARLIQFLRSGGMNVKLAARRFVMYWECRKEIFGPQKFTMRMTMTEALRDDLVAIEEGVLFLLPLVDLSGRLLLFIEPHRRQADQYSSESLLRAIWYILEVAAEKITDIGNDCVLIGFDKTSTIFDFPRAVYDRFIEFEKTCLPVRFAAVHSCCPNVSMNVMRPVMLALTDMRTRARTIVHDVAESAILDALISYGITNEMLPTELGGTVVLNQREWMANRRATEMEELY